MTFTSDSRGRCGRSAPRSTSGVFFEFFNGLLALAHLAYGYEISHPHRTLHNRTIARALSAWGAETSSGITVEIG